MVRPDGGMRQFRAPHTAAGQYVAGQPPGLGWGGGLDMGKMAAATFSEASDDQLQNSVDQLVLRTTRK